MIIARWKIDARFGHKQAVQDSLRKWNEEIGTQIGWSPDKIRMMTGSVGVEESTIVLEVELENLTALDKSWEKLSTMKKHQEWSKEMEPLIVSGSHRWDVYRVM